MALTIGITANPLILIEDEGTETTITFNVDGEIPDGGVIITLDNDTPGALADLDVFSFGVNFTGSQLVTGNADNSGLSLRILENTASITLPTFDDNDLPPDDPNATRNDDIGVEETTFFLAEDEAYDIDPNASQVTFTLADTASQLNTPPVAVNDNYTTAFETVLTVSSTEGILSNDSDDDSDELTATLIDEPNNGTLTFNTDGSFNYEPNSDFSGTDSFTYQVNDGSDNSNTATVNLTVEEAPNLPPVAENDNYTTPFETVLSVTQTNSLLINDSDEDGDELTATVVDEPSNGNLTLNLDGSFNYTPNSSFSGNDSFTYQVNDGTDNSNIATVNLNIGDPTNTPPLAENDNYTTPFETVLTVSSTEGIISNDSDDDSDELTATLIDEPNNGTLTFNADGSFNYEPNSDFSGTDSFTYQVNDGSDNSNIATVNLTVEEQPKISPIAVNDNYVTPFETTLTVNLNEGILSNDSDDDGDNLTATLVEEPNNGTLTFNADGSFNYEPNSDFSGNDSFTYQVNDGSDNSNIATVDLTVEEAPTIPTVRFTATPETLIETEATELTFGFELSEPPPEEGVTIILESDISQGFTQLDLSQVNLSGVGEINDASPNLDFSAFAITILEQTASVSLPIFLDDIDEDIQPISFSIAESEDYNLEENITPILINFVDDSSLIENPQLPPNQPPVLTTPIVDQAGLQRVGFSLNLTRNFSDPENEALTYSVTGLPANIEFDSDTGLIAGIPVETGLFNITVTASDPQNNQIQESFELQISPFVVPQLPPPFPEFTDDREPEPQPDPEIELDPIIPIEIEVPTPELNSVIDADIIGDLEDNELIGTEENNAILGSEGQDTLAGLEGNDNLFGGENSDRIIGGVGTDIIFGGKGDDSLFGDDDSEGSSQRQDFILGDEGDDFLSGNQGEDTLIGGDGNDSLYGGKADDFIFGGEDDDFLSGDAGDDTLVGGNGRDRILLSTDQGTDTIVGFEPGIDSFELAEGLTLDELRTTQQNGLTQIRLADTEEILAVLDTPADELDISLLDNLVNPETDEENEDENTDEDETNEDETNEDEPDEEEENNQTPETPSNNETPDVSEPPEDDLIQVSFSASPDTLLETEETPLTFQFSLDQPPPEDGLRVYIDSDFPQSLTQLDLRRQTSTGGSGFPIGDFDFTGFAFTITEQTASISIPIFDDSSLPAEESVEGAVPITYRLVTRNAIDSQDLTEVERTQSISEYLIDPSLNSATIIFADNIDSLV